MILLPDLYIRKLRIIEKIHAIRRNYLPRENRISPNTNLKDERPFSQWDQVLQEMKWISYDFREERKYKIALAYHCSRRIMKQTKQENIYNKELILYHKLVSHEMAEIVRNEFQSLNKENKELENDKMSIEIENNSVQNDNDVLDLDIELKPKFNSLISNNLNNNSLNITPPGIKKPATVMQLSTFSIPSSKIRKKGITNTIKPSQNLIPVIKKQPLLIEFMRKTVEFAGMQSNDDCCLIDKIQTYENLAKLFKRFPKKTKHLKSSVPDIFNNQTNLQGPMITPFDENIKGNNAINQNIEGSGQKKRKKIGTKEDGVKGNSVFQVLDLKKGADFLNFKKLKNPENFDEVLTMFYNEQKIGEGDYQKNFQNSVKFCKKIRFFEKNTIFIFSENCENSDFF